MLRGTGTVCRSHDTFGCQAEPNFQVDDYLFGYLFVIKTGESCACMQSVEAPIAAKLNQNLRHLVVLYCTLQGNTGTVVVALL